MLLLFFCRCPGGGMADAEDLKSSGDFSSCGFDSHPGHQSRKFRIQAESSNTFDFEFRIDSRMRGNCQGQGSCVRVLKTQPEFDELTV